MRYGRDFGGRRSQGGRNAWGGRVPHDYAIDYGYRRGGFQGSRMGGGDNTFGGQAQGMGDVGAMGGGARYGGVNFAGNRGGGSRTDFDFDRGMGGFPGTSMGGGGPLTGRALNARYGGGSRTSPYGHSDMGVSLGNEGRGELRRGLPGGRSLGYDIGYGLGNDREWF